MAVTKLIKTIFQFRRGTTAEWELNKDVIPAPGEPCFDLDLNELRIGNGTDSYAKLTPIGGVKVEIAADEKSIVLEDGTLKLFGLDTAEVGAQPRKTAEGGIEWVVPAQVDVEGMQTTINELQTNVTNLETNVTNIQNIITPSEGTPLLSRLETLETKMDGTGEGTVDAKIDAKIAAFAESVSENGKVDTLMELIDYVETHGKEAADLAADLKDLHGLVGLSPVSEQIASAISDAEERSKHLFDNVKYEIVGTPTGTLVDYREKEIRIMCHANTKFEKQNVGPTGDANSYYVGFKAYAPAGAVGFKEDLEEVIVDNTMYSFEGNDFAGTDNYGRKYSIVWLPVAKYDEATQTWTYYGEKSTTAKYLGFFYSVEWYDADGVVIDSDCIRINLSNESCHTAIAPYYMGKVIKEVAVNGSLLDVVNGRVNIQIGDTVNVKSSDEIDVAEDGTLSIKQISFSKIVQDDEQEIVLDGGNAG